MSSSARRKSKSSPAKRGSLTPTRVNSAKRRASMKVAVPSPSRWTYGTAALAGATLGFGGGVGSYIHYPDARRRDDPIKRGKHGAIAGALSGVALAKARFMRARAARSAIEHALTHPLSTRAYRITEVLRRFPDVAFNSNWFYHNLPVEDHDLIHSAFNATQIYPQRSLKRR